MSKAKLAKEEKESSRISPLNKQMQPTQKTRG